MHPHRLIWTRPRRAWLVLATLVCLGAVGVGSASADVPFHNDWTPLAKLNPDVKLNGVSVVASHPDEVFVLADFSEVGHSSDSGVSWTSTPSAQCIAANDGPLAVDPADTSTMFMPCQAGGLLRSDDGGATWQPVDFGDASNPSPDIRGVAIAPSAPDTVYAISESSANGTISTVYRSVDGGVTWDATTVPGLDDETIVIDPADPDRAVIGGRAATASGSLLTTDDGGDTWTPHTGPWTSQLAFDPSDPSHVWAAAGAVEESTDYGATWTAVPEARQPDRLPSTAARSTSPTRTRCRVPPTTAQPGRARRSPRSKSRRRCTESPLTQPILTVCTPRPPTARSGHCDSVTTFPQPRTIKLLQARLTDRHHADVSHVER